MALALNRLACRFPEIERFAIPARLPLVRHGRIRRANLQKE